VSTNQELIAEARRHPEGGNPLRACNLLAALADALESLQSERDAEMLRVKACEHIAEGDEGWEVLQNECPSTAVGTPVDLCCQSAVDELLKQREAVGTGLDVREYSREDLPALIGEVKRLQGEVARERREWIDAELQRGTTELQRKRLEAELAALRETNKTAIQAAVDHEREEIAKGITDGHTQLLEEAAHWVRSRIKASKSST
jgi:uncharacterized protein YicC (UPF0701 family)